LLGTFLTEPGWHHFEPWWAYSIFSFWFLMQWKGMVPKYNLSDSSQLYLDHVCQCHIDWWSLKQKNLDFCHEIFQISSSNFSAMKASIFNLKLVL
jgi:hypothetical protein